MHMLLSWLVLAVAFWLAAQFVPGFKLKGFGTTLAAAALFGLLNFFIGWLLFGVIGIATLGLGFLLAFVTRFIVNVILLHVTASWVEGFDIDGFFTASVGAIVIAGVGTLGQWGLRLVL